MFKKLHILIRIPELFVTERRITFSWLGGRTVVSLLSSLICHIDYIFTFTTYLYLDPCMIDPEYAALLGVSLFGKI